MQLVCSCAVQQNVLIQGWYLDITGHITRLPGSYPQYRQLKQSNPYMVIFSVDDWLLLATGSSVFGLSWPSRVCLIIAEIDWIHPLIRITAEKPKNSTGYPEILSDLIEARGLAHLLNQL